MPTCPKKDIPITGCGGPQACETSKLPYFLENRPIDGGEVVSPTHWPPSLSPGIFLVLISIRVRVDLTTRPIAIARQCWILGVSQTYRPPRPVTGIALLFTKEKRRKFSASIPGARSGIRTYHLMHI
jgi:hypothetical protein